MPNSQRHPTSQKSSFYPLIGLTVALLAWGAFLAVGSYLGGANLQDSSRRGLVVFGCVAIFLVLWWTLLLTRQRTQKQRQSQDDKADLTKRPL